MKNLKVLSALILIGALAPAALAQSCKKCTSCGKKICLTEATTEKVKKSYYDVKCETICLPPARFLWPWKKNCRMEPQAKRTRTVRKLVKKSYEVEELRYKFTACDKCPDCQAACAKPDCTSCGAQPVEVIEPPTKRMAPASSFAPPMQYSEELLPTVLRRVIPR